MCLRPTRIWSAVRGAAHVGRARSWPTRPWGSWGWAVSDAWWPSVPGLSACGSLPTTLMWPSICFVSGFPANRIGHPGPLRFGHRSSDLFGYSGKQLVFSLLDQVRRSIRSPQKQLSSSGKPPSFTDLLALANQFSTFGQKVWIAPFLFNPGSRFGRLPLDPIN